MGLLTSLMRIMIGGVWVEIEIERERERVGYITILTLLESQIQQVAGIHNITFIIGH